LPELSSFANQPGGMGQCAHWHGTVIGGHSAKLATGYEDGACAEIRGT
jgi:hypothetical protein